MLNIVSKIAHLRKENGWPKGALATRMEVPRDVIGTCQRNENSHSLEMASKITESLGVIEDCRAGSAEKEVDKATFTHLQGINRFWDVNNSFVLKM